MIGKTTLNVTCAIPYCYKQEPPSVRLLVWYTDRLNIVKETQHFPSFPPQVRLILRDLSGKFSWDASLLYAPPDECVQEQPTQKHPPHPPHSPHQPTQTQVTQQQQATITSVVSPTLLMLERND